MSQPVPKTGQRRVVVLGAGGFLGSAMTRHLAAAGHQVTAYWRHPRGEIAELPHVTSVVGDIRDTWTLAEAVRDVDVIYHFASSTHPSLFFHDPAAEYAEAMQPLIWLMETAAHNGARKIVFPSSGGTLYADDSEPRRETSTTDPRSPYAIFKLASEQLLLHAARQGHFSVDVFRIGNPYGPGQRPRPGQGVVPHWVEAIQQKRPIRLFGDGSAQRDYVFVRDACELMSLSLDRVEQSGIFNLGTGSATSLTELLRTFGELVAQTVDVERVPARASDIQSIALCPQRLVDLAGGYQFTTLSDGLRATLAAYGLIESSTENGSAATDTT